ncbi:MAG: L,D-transpeptidase family protein [Lachnospiraceae bacterium]|nr:L,D-transpeptidase family protein [Lachnospiraceae bacterium]
MRQTEETRQTDLTEAAGVPEEASSTRPGKRLLLPLLLGIPVLCIAAAYFAGVFYYQTHFVGGTVIDQVDVSGKTIEDLEAQIADYTLSVIQRQSDGTTLEEDIPGSKIGLSYSSTEPFEDILENQNAWLWFLRQEESHELTDLISFDPSSLEAEMEGLRGFQEDFVTEPEDAYITDYDPQEGFQLVEEIQGNRLNHKKTLEALEAAVETLSERVDLDEADCYEKPRITRESEELKAALAKLQAYTDTTITYTFGQQKEVLDGSVISGWLTIDGSDVTLEQAQVEEYVSSLRKKYDTVFRPRTFQTSYGAQVTIKNGDYGWWMDTEQEVKELTEQIEEGKSGERVPVYRQTAASYDTPDYGDTYVEINLTAQHLFLYKDGQMILESDFVSGNVSRGYTTPGGIFGLTYKQRDATLTGETYRTPVSFWMPFNNNIGMHDATWRVDFGKNIYLTNGSHGCINLPYSVAKEIYGYVEKGTPVICYYLPGTEYVPEAEIPLDPSQQEAELPPEEAVPEPVPEEVLPEPEPDIQEPLPEELLQ